MFYEPASAEKKISHFFKQQLSSDRHVVADPYMHLFIEHFTFRKGFMRLTAIKGARNFGGKRRKENKVAENMKNFFSRFFTKAISAAKNFGARV
jgi:serine acetyltransferase